MSCQKSADMKRQTTIKDIAKYLNISVATVSRALANLPNVKATTRNKVLNAAKQLNYHPNLIALKLQKNRSRLIGLVVPELRTSFFPLVIAGIQKVLSSANYQLIITQSDESKTIEAQNLQILENHNVEGIIISISREGENKELYTKLMQNGIPLVFFNRVTTLVNAPKVIIDDYKFAFLATEHLIYNGFKKIYHFAGPKNLCITEKRKKGFIDAMHKHHKELTDKSIITVGVLMEKGYAAMKQVLATQDIPDAVFCFNDPLALGALKAMKEEDIRCPEQIALVGFSETEIAQLVTPTLTSVAQPTLEIGMAAANLVIEQINTPDTLNPHTICLNACLNIRDSSQSSGNK